MFRKFLFLFIIFSSFLLSQSSFANRTEIILDVSGSMNKALGGQSRIEVARQSIGSALQGIPDSAVVALRLYGHRIPHTDKINSCKDSELVVPFGPINKSQIQSFVNLAQPKGETPIAYSLQLAAADFGAISSDEQVAIILVSDGEESCGGDPLAVLRDLMAKGFKIKVHTVGIDVSDVARSQLQAISNLTGGTYKDAKDAASLSSSLQSLAQDTLLVKKTTSVYGDAIRGGDSYETAVALPVGKLFHLDHHQRVNQFDYFYVDVVAGQKLVATIKTSESGVTIQGDVAQANTNPYAGISVHSPSRVEIKRQDIIGDKSAKKQIEVAEGIGGKYFILIGSIYDPQHKDQPFQVDLIDQYDANSSKDAGGDQNSALEIALGNYEKNTTSPNDLVDFYKLNAQAGQSFEIKVRPLTASETIEVFVLDSDGVELGNAKSPNEGAAAFLASVTAKQNGPLYIKIGPRFAPYVVELPYTFSVALAQAGAGNVQNNNLPIVNQNLSNPSVNSPDAAVSLSPSGLFVQNTKTQFSSLGFFQKAKLIFLYFIVPTFTLLLLGFGLGYWRGRRKAKKMIAAASAQNT